MKVWAIVERATDKITDRFADEVISTDKSKLEAKVLRAWYGDDLKVDAYTLTPGHDEVRDCETCSELGLSCDGESTTVAAECMPNNYALWQPREEGG